MWDLRHEPFLTLTHGTGLRTVLESACAEVGFSPQIQTQTNDLDLLAEVVAQGTARPCRVPRPGDTAARVARTARTGLDRQMVMVWHRHHRSAPCRTSLEAVRGAQRREPVHPRQDGASSPPDEPMSEVT